jgi:hypothetical protein
MYHGRTNGNFNILRSDNQSFTLVVTFSSCITRQKNIHRQETFPRRYKKFVPIEDSQIDFIFFNLTMDKPFTSTHQFWLDAWPKHRTEWKAKLFTDETWQSVKEAMKSDSRKHLSKHKHRAEARLIWEMFVRGGRTKGPIKDFINKHCKVERTPRKVNPREDRKMFHRPVFVSEKLCIPNNQMSQAGLTKYFTLLFEVSCEKNPDCFGMIILSDFIKDLFKDELESANLDPNTISYIQIQKLIPQVVVKGERPYDNYEQMDKLEDDITSLRELRKTSSKSELLTKWNELGLIQIPVPEPEPEPTIQCFRDSEGRIHRADGPAVIFPNGAMAWYYKDEFIMATITPVIGELPSPRLKPYFTTHVPYNIDPLSCGFVTSKQVIGRVNRVGRHIVLVN